MAEGAELRFDDAEWKNWQSRIKRNLSDIAPILKRLYATIGFRDIIDHFKKEEGPDGKWKPRSKFTQERYDAIRQGKAEPDPGVSPGSYSSSNKLLQLTGNLRKSILPANTRVLNKHSILAFANDPKGGKHDRGDEAGSPRIPARPFMWLSNNAKRDIVNALGRMVLE